LYIVSRQFPICSTLVIVRLTPLDLIFTCSTSYSLILVRPSPLSFVFVCSHLGDIQIISTFHHTSSPPVSDPFYCRNCPFNYAQLSSTPFDLIFAHSRLSIAIIDRLRLLSSRRSSNHIILRLPILSHIIFHHTSRCRRKGYLPGIILVLL
jgi:hypothetical protein